MKTPTDVLVHHPYLGLPIVPLYCYLGPLLLTWIDFNLSMNKQ